MKKPITIAGYGLFFEAGAVSAKPRVLVAVAAENPEQRQQVDENVIQIQVDRERSGDVIRLTAVHDALHVEQDVGGENHDCHDRNREHQRRQLQEDVCDRSQNQHDHAHEQPLGET